MAISSSSSSAAAAADPTFASCSAADTTLAACSLISDRIHAALADNSSSLILHRSQWQCLAHTYSKVLQALTRLLQQLQHEQQQHEAALIIGATLHVLHQAMVEGERCMDDCTAKPSLPFTHSWLLDKALKLGASTDVVDVHLHEFLWAFSTVLENALNIAPQIVNVEYLLQLTRALSDIWACKSVNDDLLSACDFLTVVKSEEAAETCRLAEFMLHKLSQAQELESRAPDCLPEYLWVDWESLQRKPEVLGKGGYGIVQEAVWLGGRFAVKDFPYLQSSIVFEREAAIQARLRHPNVIPLVCCTTKPAGPTCSLVMELMQQDLRALMIQRTKDGMSPPFSLGVAVDLMLQVAQGMEYLHSLHIMHRDLKSSNILVSFPRDTDRDVAHLKIADFGMSKSKNASSKYTTKPVGTTLWRAPEVFETDPEDEMEGDSNAKYTKKADVYSFGLVCYEIMTGQSPFEGPQVRKRVLAGERPLLPTSDDCPRALSSLIESCWDAEPSKRPPFSQICRILRYLKAVILSQGHNILSPQHYGWLSQPLSLTTCARIDDRVGNSMQPGASPFQPQPLYIPLEMYCCREVLQGGNASESTSDEELTYSVTGIKNTRKSLQLFNTPPDEHYRSGIKLQQGQGKSSREAKVSVLGWLKRLLCIIPGTRLVESDFQDAPGPVKVRDFTFRELQVATAGFSKKIGGGGYANVYYGQLEDGREVAVKVPKKNAWKSGQSRELLQELRIASQLRHRNIVPLFGWCQLRAQFYLVYGFMPNRSLASHVYERPSETGLNWAQRYKVACQLASALKYLHHDAGSFQIVHGDVQAWNVLLDSEWNARLGDCGIALSMAGTLGYMQAPESFHHYGRPVTASDVYCFGVVVFVIVTGKTAYDKSFSCLRDWVWKQYELGDLEKVADVRLEGEFEETEMKRLLLLGLSCTSLEPHLRPRSEVVLEILSGMSEPPPIPSQKYGQQVKFPKRTSYVS